MYVARGERVYACMHEEEDHNDDISHTHADSKTERIVNLKPIV